MQAISAHSKTKEVRSESPFYSGSGAVTHLPLPYSLFPTMPVDPLSPAAAAASPGETPKRERSPPQSQSPQSPTVKHPRNNVDMDDIVEKLDKAMTEGDNNAFIQKTAQSIRKLCEVTKDQSNFINKYAELHEMHHKSFFNASQAVKKLREDSTSYENAMRLIKDETIKTRVDLDNVRMGANDIGTRLDALKLRDVDPMEDALKDFNERINNIAREVEHSRNKIFNLEEKTTVKFDKITEDIKSKIFQMDNVDEKIKEVVIQSFSEHEIGKGIMEAMAEGMHAQGSEIMKMRKDLDLTNEQLPQLAVQYSEWQHNHLQLEAEVVRLSEALQQF